MLLLSWQVTLFALLVLPAVVVDRVLSSRLVAVQRRRMQLDSDMGATIYPVRGRLLRLLGACVEAELRSSGIGDRDQGLDHGDA